MTQKEAAIIVRGFGLSFRVRNGEYRIAFKDGTAAEKEASAYYTDDIKDAVDTAVVTRRKHEHQNVRTVRERTGRGSRDGV